MTDILDLIDNATQNLCACGCGTRLPADGPSAWFASQDCQKLWSDSQATKPHEVYGRPEPWWSDRELDELGAPPARRSEQYTAIVELVTETRRLLAPPQRLRRPPVLDQPRPGFVVYPFIGGSWDGDLRAMERAASDPSMLRVPSAPPVDYWTEANEPLVMHEDVYTKRRIWMSLPYLPPLTPFEWAGHGWAWVFINGEVPDADLQYALERALSDGWQPWLYA